ncbi:hypothetical protein ABG768_012803, partial [Culter alburnus]
MVDIRHRVSSPSLHIYTCAGGRKQEDLSLAFSKPHNSRLISLSHPSKQKKVQFR